MINMYLTGCDVPQFYEHLFHKTPLNGSFRLWELLFSETLLDGSYQ